MLISLEEFDKGEKIDVELINSHETPSSLKLSDGRVAGLVPVPFIFEEKITERLKKSKNEALDASEIKGYILKKLYKNIKSKPYEVDSILNGNSLIEKMLYFLSYKNEIEIRKISKKYYYSAK